MKENTHNPHAQQSTSKTKHRSPPFHETNLESSAQKTGSTGWFMRISIITKRWIFWSWAHGSPSLSTTSLKTPHKEIIYWAPKNWKQQNVSWRKPILSDLCTITGEDFCWTSTFFLFQQTPKNPGDVAALEVGELGLAHPWAPCLESCGGCGERLVSGNDEESVGGNWNSDDDYFLLVMIDE